MKEEENAMARIAELEAALENVESILNRIGCRAMFRAARCEFGPDVTNFRLIEEDEFCRVRMPSCDSDKRSDGRNVIFVEVPKPEPEPKTNGDRIREMSNKELAEFLSDITDCGICIHDFCKANKCEGCYETMLDWLNSSAEAESEGK